MMIDDLAESRRELTRPDLVLGSISSSPAQRMARFYEKMVEVLGGAW